MAQAPQEVRAEIVDAAFRAIDYTTPGGQASARSPRRPAPQNRSTGISPQVGSVPGHPVTPAGHAVERDLPGDQPWPPASSRDVIRRASSNTIYLVDDHPNVVRFVLAGQFPRAGRATTAQSTRSRITWRWPTLQQRTAGDGLDRQALELAAHASFGTAASTDRLGRFGYAAPDAAGEVHRSLTTIMIGAIIGTTELLGIRIDHPGCPSTRPSCANPVEAAVPEIRRRHNVLCCSRLDPVVVLRTHGSSLPAPSGGPQRYPME